MHGPKKRNGHYNYQKHPSSVFTYMVHLRFNLVCIDLAQGNYL